MRWGLFILTAAVAGLVGYQAYSTSLNEIHGLTGPRFNLAVRNTPALAELDVGESIKGFEGYRMQGRYVKVAPGATIRIHDHAGRPAFSYIVNTTVDQYRSDAAGPLHMKPGDLSSEVNVSHWWRNTGGYTLAFYVVDFKKLGEKDSAAGALSKFGGGVKPGDFEIAGPAIGAGSAEESEPPPLEAPLERGALKVTQARETDLGAAFPDNPAAKGRIFRARKIAMAPGAKIDALGGLDQPSIYYVTAGEVVETRGAASDRKALHEAGAIAADAPAVIENNSERAAEILLVDIAPPIARE
jgi:quercetin dioxygenase-like cupin family protein